MSRPYGLSEDEHAALIALLRNERRPPASDPVWLAVEFAGLVVIDRESRPPVLTLTRAGARYDEIDTR